MTHSLTTKCAIASLLFFMPFFTYAQSTYSTQYDSGQHALIEAKNFQKISKRMQALNLPVLIEFHAEGCPYCKLLEEDFLQPMVQSPEYKDQIIIRKVEIDFDGDVIDFQGNTVSAYDFAERYKAYVTPTMVFVNAKGEEVADKIVGVYTPSLFSAYVDLEIEKALTKVRAEIPVTKSK